MKKISARGLACPAPVIETKKALQELGDEILCITVDNIAAKENVTRFAHSQGYAVETKSISGGDEYELTISKDADTQTAAIVVPQGNIVNKTVYITDDKVGSNDELGKILMKGFIHTIKEADELPNKIIFVNRGVLITCQWEDSIEDLKELAEMGITIYSCGTCLSYYEITEELQVGVIGNAYDTVNAMLTADSVIKY